MQGMFIIIVKTKASAESNFRIVQSWYIESNEINRRLKVTDRPTDRTADKMTLGMEWASN